jgi:hypothetical protein
MPQQDYYSRTLYLRPPLGRMSGGTSEATALDAGSTADVKFVEVRGKTTATSGCTRGAYICLYANGAGMEGEAVRARTVVNAAVAGGVHGLHGGVDMQASGDITGLAAGVRGTFYSEADVAFSGGTVCGGMSELYAGGANTNFGGFTNHAIHRFVVDGNATGKNTADYALDFAVTVSGAGIYTNGVTNTNMLATLTEAIKCKINGLDVYLPFATAIT